MMLGYVILADAAEAEEKSLSEVNSVVSKLDGVKDGPGIHI